VPSQVQIGASITRDFLDKRRIKLTQPAEQRLRDADKDDFVANGAGTTTTIVGANAAPGTNDANVARRGEKGQLYTSGGVLKEETVFTITGIAVAGSTTLTFSPTAAVATASGDIFKFIESGPFDSIQGADDRLTAISSTTFSAKNLGLMSENDKVYALRMQEDRASGVPN
jgi:hypothetical protein